MPMIARSNGLGEGFEPSTDTAFYDRRLYPWATLEVKRNFVCNEKSRVVKLVPKYNFKKELLMRQW